MFIFRGLATTPQALTGTAQRDWCESIWPPKELKHLCILISFYSIRSRPHVFGNVLKMKDFFSPFSKESTHSHVAYSNRSPVHTKTLKRWKYDSVPVLKNCIKKPPFSSAHMRTISWRFQPNKLPSRDRFRKLMFLVPGKRRLLVDKRLKGEKRSPF